MTSRKTVGFTIIETVLFLAITGLLVLGLLVAVSSSVNIQRYNDASETLKSVLQEQYSRVTNVQNARSESLRCTNAGGVEDTGLGEVVGQSPCTIVGRYMTIHGGDINIYTVLARQHPTTINASNDIADILNNYNLNLSADDVEIREMEWGTEIAWPSSGAGAQTPQTPREIALLFLRSPESGRVYTFSSNTTQTPAQIKDMNPDTAPNFLRDILSNTPGGQSAVTLCIESGGLFDFGKRAIFINSYASSNTAIELKTNDMLVGQQC